MREPDEAVIEENLLHLQKFAVQAALAEGLVVDAYGERCPLREIVTLKLVRTLATIPSTTELEVPATWFDHLLLTSPRLRKIAGWFQREPQRKIYRVDMLLPDWLRDHPICQQTRSVPTFTWARSEPKDVE